MMNKLTVLLFTAEFSSMMGILTVEEFFLNNMPPEINTRIFLILSSILFSLVFFNYADAYQNTSTIEGIVDTCYMFLESHLCEGKKWGLNYHFYRPSLEKYSPDQWLWDSGSHQIVWSHRNVTNSILDLRTMLQMQQPDGRIPEEIFWSDSTLKDDLLIKLQYSNAKFTDTTQMPVLPFSLRSIYENSGKDKNTLREFLYPMINYFKWWRNTRDLGDGLVIAIHNWETGLDASPAYDPAFHVYVTELNQSSFLQLYPKFIELAESYKFLYHWDVEEIIHRETAPDKPSHIDNWFMVKDLALNSVYAAGWDILADLALELNDDTTANYCKEESNKSSSAILKKMWIKDQNRFNSLYIDTDGIEKASKANSIQNLFPLLLKSLPVDKLNFLVGELMNPNKFYGKFAIPTVAMDDPQFSATFDVDLMWRGPVWGFTNWFILEGLGYHEKYAQQESILNKWIDLVRLSGIYEHYNPITGEPYGPEGLGMSTLICDWIFRYGWA